MSRTVLTPDLCVIGAGSGGLVTAAGAAMLGRSVVLFEAGKMGGDCLNYGCVPSKALLAAAHRMHQVRTAHKLGVNATAAGVDFPAVMDHVRGAIKTIEPADSQERFEGLGVTVIRERARFADADTVVSDGYEIRAKRIVVATGGRAALPAVEGLADTPHLTNETIWELDALPDHLAILGGGPIGMELGQAFVRLGAKVTIIEAAKVLAPFEREHAELAAAQLRADGAEIIEGMAAERAETSSDGVALTLKDGRRIEASHLLVAAGRQPNVEGLGLEAAGIEHDAKGLVCDDRLRTTNRRVFAAGDIAGKGALTHIAGWHGSVIVRNLYFGLPTNAASAAIPACVYTEPGLAKIGLTEAEARERHGESVSVSEWSFGDNDRAVAEGAPEGGVKLVLGKGGKVLGAHAAGARADDVLAYVASVMASGGKASALTSPVLPYPTRAEAFKRAASRHYESLVFGPLAKRWAGLLARLH